MLCRVEMPNHEALFGRFYRYRLLKGVGGGSRFSVVVLPILVVLVCLLMLMTGINPGVALVPAVLVGGYLIYTLYVQPGALFRKQAGAALQTIVYLFTDTNFTRSVRSEEGGLPDNSSLRYDGLVMAVETAKDFYLFTSPKQAYLVDKEYFTKGTPDELRETLRRVLGAKFKGPK